MVAADDGDGVGLSAAARRAIRARRRNQPDVHRFGAHAAGRGFAAAAAKSEKQRNPVAPSVQPR